MPFCVSVVLLLTGCLDSTYVPSVWKLDRVRPTEVATEVDGRTARKTRINRPHIMTLMFVELSHYIHYFNNNTFQLYFRISSCLKDPTCLPVSAFSLADLAERRMLGDTPGEDGQGKPEAEEAKSRGVESAEHARYCGKKWPGRCYFCSYTRSLSFTALILSFSISLATNCLSRYLSVSVWTPYNC